MSEYINNRSNSDKTAKERKEKLKEIIKELHGGASPEEVQQKFKDIVGNISVNEISELENALMSEEGIPVEEVQRLCSVHARIFGGSIEDIHTPQKPEETNGHPVQTFNLENRAIEELLTKIEADLNNFENGESKDAIFALLENLNLLYDIDKHYSRKENLLFPYLEKYGVTGPTKVMWGVDDTIRAHLKKIKLSLNSEDMNKNEVAKDIESALHEIREMIFKEENILFPMALETLTEDEWVNIVNESDEIGFCLIAPQAKFAPQRTSIEKSDTNKIPENGFIKLETGTLSLNQLERMLDFLPVDITFIDENDIVRFFSNSPERIFPRTKAVLGRSVQNCHPPKSVHVVEKILKDFKAGEKDLEDFWIKMGDKYIYIRYFAIRDKDGVYMGTLEFTQNIAPIQNISGEKRIVS